MENMRKDTCETLIWIGTIMTILNAFIFVELGGMMESDVIGLIFASLIFPPFIGTIGIILII